MPAMNWAILGVVGLAFTTTAGDWSLKLASQSTRPLQNFWSVLGFVVYGMTSVGWIHVMRHLKLATVGWCSRSPTSCSSPRWGASSSGSRSAGPSPWGSPFGVLSLCLLTRTN